jgi:hypothetical protein
MGGYKLSLREEEELLKKHEDLLQNQVLPDIESLKKITLNHEEKMRAIEENQKEYNIQQAALKNDVQGVNLAQTDLKLTIQQMGQDLKEQNSKLFDHVLTVDRQKREQTHAIRLANLDLRGKVIVAVLGSSSLILAGYTIYEKVFAG